MDVYHQVLIKLYEESEGKTGKTVNLMTLAKSIGLHGNYGDIFEHLNREGWIAESVKADFVVITPDGARQARKTLDGAGGNQANKLEVTHHLNRTAALARELADLLEAKAKDSVDDFTEITAKMTELQTQMAQLKANFS